MTHFDNLLKAAFEAGYEWARHEDDWTHIETGEYVGDNSVPTFEEWRATLSGLDTREDLGPIEVGDSVRVLSSWGETFRDYHGLAGEVLGRGGSAGHFVIATTYTRTRLVVPALHLEKLRP
jgi:hypothetical protein